MNPRPTVPAVSIGQLRFVADRPMSAAQSARAAQRFGAALEHALGPEGTNGPRPLRIDELVVEACVQSLGDDAECRRLAATVAQRLAARPR
ncbi:hypothetical protein GCM10028796_20870 [Ramlibacter monticola]|uniref:Uncharacterized protein n=1 Tax=Ramlibacter monticola TaxID=1926872 RepID=A0A937CTB1_9BURK|nr:hypothetical protein [Ramlibacter monticola]MBL0392340.1 hypothetical protein [Ramlibacter monticola]